MADAQPLRGPSRALPTVSRIGSGAIVFGLLLDINEHVFAGHVHTAAAGFAPGEHLAHLVVLVGMVVVLAGIVAGGTHTAGRMRRQEGSLRDAIR